MLKCVDCMVQVMTKDQNYTTNAISTCWILGGQDSQKSLLGKVTFVPCPGISLNHYTSDFAGINPGGPKTLVQNWKGG